jgi:ABC-type polysaccharide/polyol phosphate transport system ATPase subunit
MSDTVIQVSGLYKKFTRSLKRSIAYGTVDLAKSFVGLPVNTDNLRKGEFWALEDINFSLNRGDSLGVVGSNGSGKSTLLRLLTGIFPPDRGEITIKGRVGALIAVGAGFHPHMTGRENVYLNGTILGMSRAEINSKFSEIVEFADIGEFIDAPVSTYSSGMRVRLGFAIAVKIRPEILLVDEVLAVGDQRFRYKARKEMDVLLNSGSTVIFISHNIHEVVGITQSAIWLEGGKIKSYGKSADICQQYLRAVTSSELLDDYEYIPKRTGFVELVGLESAEITEKRKISITKDSQGTAKFTIDLKAAIDMDERVYINFQLQTMEGQNIGYVVFSDWFKAQKDEQFTRSYEIDLHNLHIGDYKLRFEIGTEGGPLLEGIENLVYFNVENSLLQGAGNLAFEKMLGNSRGSQLLNLHQLQN